MNILEIILVFYLLPMVVNLVGFYFEDDVKTLGDLTQYWTAIFIPIYNLVFVIGVFIFFLTGKLKTEEFWKKLKDVKIKSVVIILSSFLLFSCGNVEQRIKEHSYTEKWYNIDTLRFQVYKTKSGREYIIILNERETRFKRKYIN